ncbi:thioredoxin domain-containing protein 17-like [Musca vetustissima]|uniref:thioredoxin domain-containing protein 17-like n=1 Tax=Musca vetustissima TaxID=27455 RepID=UPI002AB649AD|nr:thioredoxin domain-containing protein 17-like [Musca vetustissima]
MVIEHNVQGYDDFKKLVGELEQSGKPIYVLFSGGKDENGESWCPYCVTAEPVVHEALSKAPADSHFIHVIVGERSYWKDPNNPFRKDPKTHLVWVPTLMRWNTQKRVDSDRCSKKDLVEMVFEDDE